MTFFQKMGTVFFIALSSFLYMLTAEGENMAKIAIEREQSTETIRDMVAETLLGKHISSLHLFFEENHYKRIIAVDLSGVGTSDFFEQTHGNFNFSGKINLILVLQSKSFFSASQPRISMIVTVSDGVIQAIDRVQWFSK